jgi:hypothetical protein
MNSSEAITTRKKCDGDGERSGSPAGKRRRARRCYGFAVQAALLCCLLPAPARSQSSGESAGKNSGNYNIQQTVEFGYRDSLISGNLNNYNTFVNLNTGVRLFDYTADIRSIDHRGILFDNLSFSNFGYGGDPNNVSRLRISKNKWYEFRATYRRGQGHLEL